MDTGNKIRKVRKNKHLSMKELGRMIGVSEQAISQYERGLRKVPLEIVFKISEALDVSITYLLQNQEEDEMIEQIKKKYEEKNKILSGKVKEHLKNMESLPNYKKLYFIYNLIGNILKKSNIELTILTNEDVAKLQLVDNKDGYTKIFETAEEAQQFFNEISYGMQSSVDRLKYYDKNNVANNAKDLTELSKYTNPECDFEVDTIAAHNDYLDEEGEMENIIKDLEDMDKWQ